MLAQTGNDMCTWDPEGQTWKGQFLESEMGFERGEIKLG